MRELAPVHLYWHAGRGDNFTTATAQGRADALAAGYEFVRAEGWTYTTNPDPASSLQALDLFWHAGRGDNFTTATGQGKADAQAAGYQLIRTEAWVYNLPQPGDTYLELFWNPQREDNFTTASPQGKADAAAAGYQLVRAEGWLYQPLEATWFANAPKVFWNEGFGDHRTTVTQASTVEAATVGYNMLRGSGLGGPAGMAPPGAAGAGQLELYWHEARRDSFTTASPEGKASAKDAGYQFVREEGWVWLTPAAVPPGPGYEAYPLKLFWNPNLEDNALVAGTGSEEEQRVLQMGYSFVRDEGYLRRYALPT